MKTYLELWYIDIKSVDGTSVDGFYIKDNIEAFQDWLKYYMWGDDPQDYAGLEISIYEFRGKRICVNKDIDNDFKKIFDYDLYKGEPIWVEISAISRSDYHNYREG